MQIRSTVWAVFILLACQSGAKGQQIPSYVGSSVCEECHSAETEAWKGSHHAKAWTTPRPEHVLGDFRDETFTLNGVTSRFYRDGQAYMIDTDGPDGQMTSYPVHSVAGIEPLQQYVLETETGRLQSFDVVWDIEGQRWIHLYPDQELKGGDGLHWTGTYKNWNGRCAECHATGFAKNYSPDTRTYESSQIEIGVGCEACHGPAEAHLAWANGQTYPSRPEPPLSEHGFIIDIGSGGETLLQQCAGCHARREPFEDGNPLPGTPFDDAYRLSLLRDGTYHADGQILDEVYVYGSFLQSKMYASGVTCNDCHEPHSATLRSTGNSICTQCHSAAGNPRFPSLRLVEYDSPEHHFHEPGTSGAECKSCHMIERDYMVVDGRRDHSFRVPRPDLSLETRSPNACNDCHTNQNSAWAADTIEGWYPTSELRGIHFGQAIAAGRRDLRGSIEDLVSLIEDDGLPGIARATALEMLADVSTPELAARLAPTLNDPDPLVRAAAASVQQGAPENERAERLVALLADPTKAVRLAAAREFLTMPLGRLTEDAQRDLRRGLQDWQASLRVKSDFPEAHLVMGGIGLSTRRMEAALRAFNEAATLDPQLEQAWIMQIRIYAAFGDRDAARHVADEAIEANPDSIPLYLLRSDLID